MACETTTSPNATLSIIIDSLALTDSYQNNAKINAGKTSQNAANHKI